MNTETKVEFRGFRINDFHLVALEENSKSSSISKEILGMKIKQSAFCSEEDENVYKVILDIEIEGNKKINTKVEGVFAFENVNNEEIVSNFLNITAPTILYPYCRSLISMVTGYDASDSLILPIINFSNLSSEEKRNFSSKQKSRKE